MLKEVAVIFAWVCVMLCLMLLCVCVAKSLCYGLTSIIWDCRTVAMWDEGSSFGFQQVVALLFFTTSKSHVKLSVNRVRHHSDGMSLLSASESNHLFIEMTLPCVCHCPALCLSPCWTLVWCWNEFLLDCWKKCWSFFHFIKWVITKRFFFFYSSLNETCCHKIL